MPRKKAANATQTRVDMLDRIFAQVSAVEASMGVLGAIATRGGVVPPFTRLMMAITNEGVEEVGRDYVDLMLKIGSPLYTWQSSEYGFFGNLMSLFSKLNPDGSEKTAQQAEIDNKSAAAMAMGAAEYILMYNFASNPEFQKRVFNLMSGTAGGAAALAKAL